MFPVEDDYWQVERLKRSLVPPYLESNLCRELYVRGEYKRYNNLKLHSTPGNSQNLSSDVITEIHFAMLGLT